MCVHSSGHILAFVVVRETVCVLCLYVCLWSGGEGRTMGHQTALEGKKIQQHKQNHGQCDMCHLCCDRGHTPERRIDPHNLFEVSHQFGSIVFPDLGRCFGADSLRF